MKFQLWLLEKKNELLPVFNIWLAVSLELVLLVSWITAAEQWYFSFNFATRKQPIKILLSLSYWQRVCTYLGQWLTVVAAAWCWESW
jgi:hypothetical protein